MYILYIYIYIYIYIHIIGSFRGRCFASPCHENSPEGLKGRSLFFKVPLGVRRDRSRPRKPSPARLSKLLSEPLVLVIGAFPIKEELQ